MGFKTKYIMILASSLSIGALVFSACGSSSTDSGGSSSPSVTSLSYAAGSTIPDAYTCEGSNTSPQLTFNNFPAETQSIAFYMEDPDAPGGTFYHWGVVNIPAGTTTLAEGDSSGGGELQTNDFGANAYGGPCPPSGSTHRYIIQAYALNSSTARTAELINGRNVKDLPDTLNSLALSGFPVSYEASFGR